MSGLRGRGLSLVVWLLVAGLAAATSAVSAADGPSLAELKESGKVGEQMDGYVGIAADALEPAARAVVERINGERREAYGQIAAKQGLALAQVEALAGAKLVEGAPIGQLVRDSTGSWKRK